MACPWFYPTRPLADDRWAVAPRVPLIEPWEGQCRAAVEFVTPQPESLRTLCNSGYARGSCVHFIEGRGDAVRFHSQPPEAGAAFRILYSYERDCWPAGHGTIEYDPIEQRAACDDEILRRQAEAFAASYRRRTGEADA